MSEATYTVQPLKATWLSLFTSASTLLCCALPAALVALGAGASLVTLTRAIPGLIWVSENSGWVFGFAGVMLAIAAYLQHRAKGMACPIDPALAAKCTSQRRWSSHIFAASVALYLIGAFFAFCA
jgi:hypothetical protein